MDRRREEQRYLIDLALADRFKDDPLLTWVPTSRQQAFVHAVLHGETFTNWFIAANRSGKSEALAYCISFLARFGVPGIDQPTTGWAISLDANTSRDILQPKIFDNGFGPPGSRPFIPEREIEEWRLSDQILILKNKSLIGFKNMESERKKFQGVEKDYVAFDEEPEKDKYEEAVTRVGAGRRLRVFGAVTLLPPEGVVGGVSWMYPEVIQKWEMGQTPGVNVFGASIYDNPHIDREEIKRLEAVYPLGSPQRRIRLDGEYVPGMSGARVYSAFDRKIHVRGQPAIVDRRPLCWLWDFNVEPLITLVGQRDGRLFRVIKELCLDEGNVGEMCDWFRQQIPTHGAELWIYGDATGKGRSGHQTSQSDYTAVMNAMRRYGAPVRLKVPESNPRVRDRVNAVNRALKDEQGEIGLLVDPSCVELIADLEQVVVDAKGEIRKTFNRRDPYFRRTHASDALGYWIAYEEPVRAFTAGNVRSPVRIQPPSYAWTTHDDRP